jgi:hypothetical protein
MSPGRLQILLDYESEDYGTWSIYQLSRGEGVIDPASLAPDRFAEASGGIRICSDRIHCFLNVDGAGDLLSYVYFLLGSLGALAKGRVSAELAALAPDPSWMGHTGAVGTVMHLDRSRIVLREEQGALLLDHLDPAEAAPETRDSPYFRGERIAREAWVEAAVLALDEYFGVLAQLVARNKPPPGSRIIALEAMWWSNRDRF